MFPPLTPPFANDLLALDEPHVMYWVQYGNPSGQAVVILHGGPGAGMDTFQARLFDPRHYRIVCFDQRGAGSSRPSGELLLNTTSNLISDINLLREHLRIERWMVMGGSWGSSLALAYAVKFPENVSALLLRGIFLCQKSEIDWYVKGMRHVFPEAWHRFTEFLPEHERNNPLEAYRHRVLHTDPNVHLPAARQWCAYEADCATLIQDNDDYHSISQQQAITLARIQTHYFLHDFFLTKNELINSIERIRHIPGEIVQGRYDMVCPIESADSLHQSWPESRYTIVPNAGHAATEPGIRRALLAATDRLKTPNKSLETSLPT